MNRRPVIPFLQFRLQPFRQSTKVATLMVITVLRGISLVAPGLHQVATAQIGITESGQCADAAKSCAPKPNAPNEQQSAIAQWDLWVQRSVSLYLDNNFPEAIEACRRALDMTQHLDVNGPQRAITHELLADIYRYCGQWAEARANYARAVVLWEAQTNPDRKHLFTALVSLIGTAVTFDPNAAAKLLRDRYQDLRRLRSEPLDDAKLLLVRAAISDQRRRFAEAAELFRQALRIVREEPGDNTAGIAELRYLLSDELRYLGHYQASLDEAQQAIALYEGIDRRYPSLPMALNAAASTLFLLGRKEESVEVFKRALDLATTIFGEESRTTAIIMINYARVLRDLRRRQEAAAMDRRGREAFRRTSMPGREIIDAQELRVGRSHLRR